MRKMSQQLNINDYFKRAYEATESPPTVQLQVKLPLLQQNLQTFA